MNIRLMNKVLAKIEQDYNKFNMSWWYNRITKKSQAEYPSEYKHFVCGTAGCLAGHVIMESLGEPALKKANNDDFLDVPVLARTLLDISEADANEIFYSRGKAHYAQEGVHNKTPGTKGYAKAVAQGVRNYFAGKGIAL